MTENVAGGSPAFASLRETSFLVTFIEKDAQVAPDVSLEQKTMIL